MNYYAGLDVSQETTNICIMDRDGKIIKEGKVSTCPNEITKFLNSTNLKFVMVGIETGSLCHWLFYALEAQGFPMCCLCAYKLSCYLSSQRNKNDKIDARGITDALRGNFMHKVSLKSMEQLELRLILSSRESLKNQSKQASNKVRGYLKPFGIKCLGPAKTEAFVENVKSAVEELDDPNNYVKTGIEALLESYVFQRKLIEDLDKEIIKIAEETPDAKLLMTHPGVGPITALYFIVEVGDPRRFKDARAVGAYFGMSCKTYESGEVSYQGRISKQGNKMMRTLLRGAGSTVLTVSKEWFPAKIWGMRRLEKKGMKKTALAVGRKIACTLWAMLLKQTPFENRIPPKMKKQEKQLKKSQAKNVEKQEEIQVAV